MKKHTAVYVRVSTEDQKTASQLPDLTRWAEASGDACQFYTDHFNGRQMARPAMTELLADLEAGRISRIVVWRLDRLGRTAAGLCKLFDELLEREVSLVSLRDGFDLITPAGRLHARILASVAEYETEVRAERVRAGIMAAREQQDKVRALAKRGQSPDTIAVTVGIELETVRKILASPGDGLYWGGRPKGSIKKQNATHEKIREQLARGLSVLEVCKILDLSERTVRARIAEFGGMRAFKEWKKAVQPAAPASTDEVSPKLIE